MDQTAPLLPLLPGFGKQEGFLPVGRKWGGAGGDQLSQVGPPLAKWCRDPFWKVFPQSSLTSVGQYRLPTSIPMFVAVWGAGPEWFGGEPHGLGGR